MFRDTNNNPAGDLVFSAADTSRTTVPTKLFSGEQLILEVSDGNFQNCTAVIPATHRIGFNHVPTVTLQGTVNVSVERRPPPVDVGQRDAPQEPRRRRRSRGSATNDQLVVTVNAPITGRRQRRWFTISDISYDVGSFAVVGVCPIMVGDDDPRNGLNIDGVAADGTSAGGRGPALSPSPTSGRPFGVRAGDPAW